jgi:serine/threonine-protein kinase
LARKRFAPGRDWNEMLRRRAEGAEPRIREVAPDAPSALADVCDRALALAPEERFESAAALREALLQASRELEPFGASELGERVTEAFQPERARVNEIIHRNLKDSSSGSIPPLESMVVSLRPGPMGHLPKPSDPQPAPHVDEPSASDATTARKRFVPSRRGLIMLGAAASTLLALRVWFVTSDETAAPMAYELSESAATAPSSSMGAQPKAAPEATSAPINVRLVVSAEPPETSLFLDGVPLDSNPMTGTLPASGELHVLSASAPGMQPQERIISLDRDREVSFSLVRAQPGPTNEPRGPRPSSLQPSLTRLRSSGVPRADRAQRAAVVDSSAARARRGAENVEFGASLLPNSEPRPIYTEDPYK